MTDHEKKMKWEKKKLKKNKKKIPQMYRNTVNDWDEWFVWGGGDGAGIWIVQDLSSYYAKCHETPFCMTDINDEEVGRGGEEEGELEFII